MSGELTYREPFFFSLRRPGRSILGRLIVRVLVRLVIFATMPVPLQTVALSYPVSVL